MIIDDSVSFFGVYFHNCILNLGLSESFKSFYNKSKFLNVILCQKDDKGGYLMTQNITDKTGGKPTMQSYYFRDKKELKDGYNTLTNKIASSEKTFYLIKIAEKYDFSDNERLVKRWKNEVKNSII